MAENQVFEIFCAIISQNLANKKARKKRGKICNLKKSSLSV